LTLRKVKKLTRQQGANHLKTNYNLNKTRLIEQAGITHGRGRRRGRKKRKEEKRRYRLGALISVVYRSVLATINV
jgi:hypothetical protein